MSSASNTLAREFLTDVHQLCNAVAQRAEAREEDEEEEESHMVALGEYLVRGRGFLLLSTLDSIIDQELTCREELLTLLLSLLPLVWKIPVQVEKAPDFSLPLLLDVIFPTEYRKNQETTGSEELGSSKNAVGNKFKARHLRRSIHRYSIRNAQKSQLSTSDSDATSDDRTSFSSKHRRSHGLPSLISHQHHPSFAREFQITETMNSLDRTEQEQFGYSIQDSDMLTDPAALSILNRMENSPFDLCHVLLSLLAKVCKFDMELNHNPALAVSVVPTLTEFLMEFGDCCVPEDTAARGAGQLGSESLAHGWTEEPIALVQRMILRTILHLMSVDVGRRESLPDTLRRHLTDLLRATLKIRSCLEKQADPFAPRPKKTLQEIQDDFTFSKNRHRILLLPELLEGVLQILLNCLQAAIPNPFFFSQAIELIHEFVQHTGLELFETTVLQMEWLATRDPDISGEAAEHAHSLISGVLKIVSAVKKAKSEQLHQSLCARRRHRRCEYSHFLHHHRDLSGLPVSAFKQLAGRNPFEEDVSGGEIHYPDRCCCLAACTHQCLRLLQNFSSSSATCLQILTGVQAVGICCCMDPHSVVVPLLHAFRSPALRSYQSQVLSILSRLILEQLGGGQPSEKFKLASCNICTVDSSQLLSIEEMLYGSSTPGNDPGPGFSSPSYRSQGILPSGGAEDMLWKWDALEAYRDLVFNDDRQLSLQIANHICQLVQRGNAIVQWQLYTHIFNPVLQKGVELAHHAQQLGVTTSCTQICSYHSKCLWLDVLHVYLQTLPLLFKFRVIRDLFLNCNGLNQVTELIYLDSVRISALKVFETFILCIGEQQMGIGLQELETIEATKREPDEIIKDYSTFNSLGKVISDTPQSLSKFYAGLKEANPKRRNRGVKSNSEAHFNAINLFLCLAFICVSKEADSDRDSANDSEDTSGYDSTASETLHGRLPCLSPDSVVLPSQDQIRKAADIWSACRGIYLSSPMFQKQFFKLGGLDVCNRLMMILIQNLLPRHIDFTVKKQETNAENKCLNEHTIPNQNILLVSGISDTASNLSVKGEATLPFTVIHNEDHSLRAEQNVGVKDLSDKTDEWSFQSIRLFEALLVIYLHSASSFGLFIYLFIYLFIQNLSVDEIMSEIRDQLYKSAVVSSELAKPLFDSLLRVALSETSTDSEKCELKKHQLDGESSCQPSELSEDAEESSCHSIKLFKEEEGYEADSESNPDDKVAKDDVPESENFMNCIRSYNSSFAFASNSTGNGELLYPEICMLELQLLSTCSPHLEVLTHTFQSLLSAIKRSHRNTMLMYQQVKCQAVLVDLLVSLVTFQISSDELVLLLRLFLEKNPPTEILLNGFLKIVEDNMHMAPQQYLAFPLFINASSANSILSAPKQTSVLSAKTAAILKRGKMTTSKKDFDGDILSHHLSSSWHVAPIHLPLVGQNCWPHMADGFSVSLWIKTEWPLERSAEKRKKPKRSKLVAFWDSSLDRSEYLGPYKLVEDGCLHLISLGSKALMLQVWTDLNTGAFIFRICIDPNDEMKAGVLAQAESQESVLTHGTWQHIAFTYHQQPESKKNVHGKLTIWVSGERRSDVALDYAIPRKTSLSSDSNKTFCMLGHCTSAQEDLTRLVGRWQIGNLLLFNGSVIGVEEAFHLYTSGPELSSIMPCKYGKSKLNYSKYISLERLQCEKLKELLMKNSDVDTGPLVESLAIVYASSSPYHYTIYEPVIRLKGQIKTVPSQRPFSAKEIQSTILDLIALKSLQILENQGLQSILHKIGGTGSFIFLFARAVELSDCEKIQALALQLVLSLCKYNSHRIQEMDSSNGYSMIHQVLIKSKCIVGFYMLKTLLDGCCSTEILNMSEEGCLILNPESNAVIQDVKLLSEVLLDWKVWAKAQSGVWEALLAGLEILIRVNHPQQMFNIKQLLKANVVHHFLRTCQVLQEHRDEHLKSIPRQVCCSFVKIIQEVLGSPPDLDLLRMIYNFLLAVHPPTNTYVCHTPTSFYFSLHIDGKIYQEKVQSMIYLRHSSSGGRTSGSPGPPVTPSGFTEAPSEGLNIDYLFSTSSTNVLNMSKGSPRENVNEEETGEKKEKPSFIKNPFTLLSFSQSTTNRSGAPRHQWKRILWSCRETFRVQMGRLLVHVLSPARPLEERRQALDIVHEPSHPEILRECLSPSLEHGPKLALYIYEMLRNHREQLSKEDQTAVSIFMTSLKLCGHKCIPPSAPTKPDLVKAILEEQKKFESEGKMNKAAWEKKIKNSQQSLIQRLDSKSKDISKIAADITQNVSLRQGMERKKVIQHIRGMYKIDLSASRYWQELVQQLTHDRAVWYNPSSYPTSWQLDPTEGPNRERRRLQRCYLTIPNKYLLKDRQKPEEPFKPPLSYLFEDKTHSYFSSTVKDKATSEHIRFTRRCINVAPSRETPGELLLGKHSYLFPSGETEPASFSWTYEEIKEVHKRWWQLRDNAVEIFLTNGRTLLLAFDNIKARKNDVYHNILTSNLPNLLEYGNITALTHLWCSAQITNFEYLTHLNKHAGRSFNDLMQYPVFPFILRDYTNETLDLSEPSIYRNLSKPIAVQSKEKEDRYVDNYKYLEEEYRKGIREDDPMPPVQPYHYGSHYSNSGTVLHFLVRMPPFTKMFLAYQDQSFDIPDRTFHSMNTTWRLSSYESMTDVKELIPEFFYLPEFLVNREGFDFGVRQNGERVNHVNLPPWARNDPRLFILIHRQALESDQVSQTLCQWIDLVFGHKQKGKAAVSAINVFHPATYFGMDVSAVEDPVQRRALETMIKTYGQTPRQLFNAAHLSRAGSRLTIDGELPAAMGILVQFAFRETKDHVKEVVYPSPLPWIKGLKWGEYVGSPSAPDPIVCFSQPHGERFGSLLALPTRAICGLSRKFCLMMIYSKEQGVRSMHSTDIQWSAILSWGYADNILRLKSKQSEPPVNFIQCSQLFQVTSCAWVPDSCQLFTGSECGVITAYNSRFTSSTPSEVEVESQVYLYGHSGEVTSLFVCKPYSILISVSKDGSCIIWDLNRLCYVQSLTGHKSPVSAVSASETTGDIATVCDSVGGGSDLRLWTVNGDLIGHVHCREIICSVAFSNQPEGVSVNVIAGGLENGVVRLWSTWDLKPVREITFPKSNRPIVSLTYSCDGHHLYTANSEGTVIAWCRRDQQKMKLPMFYSFLSSYAAG
uniref:Lysosomal trafficking regulator n=1 Tax=Erpetoichthys calabaricus TaxID=27687 RepID=A0A8C4XEE4_ERPCA